ncbi:hypothetical protein CTAYLR_003880 [Chrysophaeum taylorii]|uniref:Uncharacterized protein n=1 Tax=Chrysophaeum taylorii TaxID=2483200 RepID=A0AAD7UL41_9STRA|nr:hypothetical protein CTAYLR_003880 [Chrysophaeum taylorii]
MTKSTETTVSALCVVATVIVLQGGSLRGGTTGEAFRAAPPPPPAAVIQKKQKPPVVAPPPPPPPPAAAAVIQKRQKPPVAASPPPPPAIKGPPPLKKQHPGIKDVWEPPARPVVGKPPARPRLPQNLGSGAGLAPERPEYASIDDTAAGERERPATARNRREAARVVGREEHWPGESVFVSIASYRDPECAKTVSRAFERAAVPERVSFGIFQQNAAADVDCVGGLADLVRCPSHAACGRVRRGQIRAYRVPWTETLGPTIARHLSERLYRNETYVMSFDAHTNFARGWDTVAIDMFKRIGNPRAIVTTYPASYAATNHSELWANVDANGPCRECRTIDDQRDAKFDPTPETQMAICRTRRVQVGRTLSFKHDVNRMRRPPRPTLVPFLAAGFNFARGERIRDVPYDAHSYFLFDGEETSLAVRAWTHGYDFYHPDRDVTRLLDHRLGKALPPPILDDAPDQLRPRSPRPLGFLG